jgi:hypothetical protein
MLDLLDFLRDQHLDARTNQLVTALIGEITEERKILKEIIESQGGEVPALKEAAAWLAEKLSRFKLARGAFGTFEALEALALGILGKLALWQTLDTLQTDSRFEGFNFTALATQAQRQHAQVEKFRLQAARNAFET